MKKEEIRLEDVHRILFGEAPPEFLLEVLVRTLIVYLAALLVFRWLGNRMSGQLTITELAVVLMMGAIISLPMQSPDRGILQGFVILLAVVGLQRGLNLWAFRNRKLEKITQGDVTLLVKDGVLQLEQLDRSNISKQQIYATLRGKSIFNLGEVKRMYLEGCGIFSVYKEDRVRVGLPVLPPDDQEVLQIRKPLPVAEVACCNCGSVYPSEQEKKRCTNCGAKEWSKAMII